jgi:hypothetical protein
MEQTTILKNAIAWELLKMKNPTAQKIVVTQLIEWLQTLPHIESEAQKNINQLRKDIADLTL